MKGAEAWQIPTREINKILSTEMDVLRRSTRKSRLERIKNEHIINNSMASVHERLYQHIQEIMGVKGKPDITDIIEKKRLQWYGHIKRMPEERIPKLIMEWIPEERQETGCPMKTWKDGLHAAMTARNVEQNQGRNREEWRLVSGRQRQLS
jgi:hypothetical protein